MAYNPNQPRELPGTPTGGRWKTEEKSPSGISLEAVSEADFDMLAERCQRLKEAGYAPPVVTESFTDVHSTHQRSQWWTTHWAQAEYGESSYPQMPDDNTPTRLPGRSLAGLRRTYRRKFDVGQMTMRMPSKAAFNRFAEETGSTFDAPVEVELPDGRQVQGWIRSTRIADGRWLTTPVGFPGQLGTCIAEAANARLEERNVDATYREISDLMNRRAARLHAQGYGRTSVRSSWIDSVGYDDRDGVLTIQTKTGNTYGYAASRSFYEAMTTSRTPGQVYNRHIRNVRSRVDAANCATCGRFYGPNAPHVCPVSHHEPTGPDAYTYAVRSLMGTATAPQPAPPADPVPPAPVPAPANPGHHRRPDERSMDLHERYRQIMNTPEGSERIYGPRGYLADSLAHIQPYTSSTYVPQMYSTSPSGISAAEELDYLRFSGMPNTAARELLRTLPADLLSERHGDAPSMKSMLTAAAKHPGKVELMGYMIDARRDDEQVCADGLYIFDESITDAGQAMNAAAYTYGLRDATARPVEVRPVEVPWRPGQKAWQLWWD